MKERKIKAFLDTNVWIFAYVYTGNEKTIMDKAINREFNSIISDQVINEFIRIMKDKFNFPKRSIFRALSEIIQISEIINIENTIDIHLKDKNDTAIVNAALYHECDYLITGDKEILRLKQIKNTKVIKPKEFLVILEKNITK